MSTPLRGVLLVTHSGDHFTVDRVQAAEHRHVGGVRPWRRGALVQRVHQDPHRRFAEVPQDVHGFRLGANVLTLNAGVSPPLPVLPVDVAAEEVARAAGSTLDSLRAANDRAAQSRATADTMAMTR